jgi:hypothetical protein
MDIFKYSLSFLIALGLEIRSLSPFVCFSSTRAKITVGGRNCWKDFWGKLLRKKERKNLLLDKKILLSSYPREKLSPRRPSSPAHREVGVGTQFCKCEAHYYF